MNSIRPSLKCLATDLLPRLPLLCVCYQLNTCFIVFLCSFPTHFLFHREFFPATPHELVSAFGVKMDQTSNVYIYIVYHHLERYN